ncbi:DUF5941 domain-containing protein [Planomonospora parontospora]|uniref:DUF5941 domain-containing protein n=1 Tax=Planomonospora parontospora TaxID=58119 RepID=UPI0016708E1B|nr:DUF5941 domain-containing protein [Planomonospora parontospora]GGL02273.1 hypothetical protein GCM10014719_00620 [Planomonospora parontospora subsp. antibiotica]GII16766.1 hypothetical protein Ppa05_34920 [Planomonospora parontospora subsp. antibiotica]
MITQPQATPAPDPYEERLRIQTARLLAYRDDGPLVTALRRAVGPGLPPVPASLAALLVVVAMAVAGILDDGPMLIVPALVMVVLVLPTAARDHLGKLDWLVPPLIRATEFLIVILVGLAADAPKWLLFVLLYVVGYHTYDTVYRTRQGIWPPDWVFRAGLGWEIRLLLLGAGAALGVLTWVLAALTLYLGVLFAIESVTSWVRLDKASASKAQESDDLETSPEEAMEQATGEAEPA